MFFNRLKIPKTYKRNRIFKFIDDYLSENDTTIKIIHNDHIIYPTYEKADDVFLHEITTTAKYSQTEMIYEFSKVFNQNIAEYSSLTSKSTDFLYFAIYKNLNYYSFYLPNSDIIYIRKNEYNYSDYLKAKLLYGSILHLIDKKRNAYWLNVPSYLFSCIVFLFALFYMQCVDVLHIYDLSNLFYL